MECTHNPFRDRPGWRHRQRYFAAAVLQALVQSMIGKPGRTGHGPVRYRPGPAQSLGP